MFLFQHNILIHKYASVVIVLHRTFVPCLLVGAIGSSHGGTFLTATTHYLWKFQCVFQCVYERMCVYVCVYVYMSSSP